MAVPTKWGAVVGTRGGVRPSQTVSGVVLTNSTTGSGGISTSFLMSDCVALNTEKVSGINERDSGNAIVRARKILSSGTFAYNAARAGTYVISRITTTLAGVASTNLLQMGRGNRTLAINFMRHDFGVRMLQAWTAYSFAWTGRLANGNSKNSRRMWLTADQTGLATLTTLTGTFMHDIADGNASDTANDHAANAITRAFPGELVMQINFTDRTLTGGNHFDYKPITGM